MSVIAAKVYEDRIEIAADSILIKDDLKKTNFKKLFNTTQMCVGGCGTAEELTLFFTFVQTHEPESSTLADIQKFMRRFDEWKEEYVKKCGIENCYLIIYENKLFEVDGMFVQEIKDYTAIGEGEPYALTALHLGYSAEDAVKVSCELCCFVSEPIRVMKGNDGVGIRDIKTKQEDDGSVSVEMMLTNDNSYKFTIPAPLKGDEGKDLIFNIHT